MKSPLGTNRKNRREPLSSPPSGFASGGVRMLYGECPACAARILAEPGQTVTCPHCGHEWGRPRRDGGYAQVPGHLLERMARPGLSAVEHRVLAAVLLNTLARPPLPLDRAMGRRTTWWRTSYRAIARIMGTSVGSAYRSVWSLAGAGLLRVRLSGGRLCLQVNEDLEAFPAGERTCVRSPGENGFGEAGGSEAFPWRERTGVRSHGENAPFPGGNAAFSCRERRGGASYYSALKLLPGCSTSEGLNSEKSTEELQAEHSLLLASLGEESAQRDAAASRKRRQILSPQRAASDGPPGPDQEAAAGPAHIRHPFGKPPGPPEEPTTAQLLPDVPPPCSKRDASATSRIARAVARAAPWSTANPVAVARAVYREVPNTEAVLAAVERLKSEPDKPANLIGWLIAASRSEQRRAAAEYEARMELQNSDLPEEVREAVIRASSRLHRSHRALAAWARSALMRCRRPDAVAHVLSLASSGTDDELEQGLSVVNMWYPVLPPCLSHPPAEAMERFFRGEIRAEELWKGVSGC
jgi:hypothetical protein